MLKDGFTIARDEERGQIVHLRQMKLPVMALFTPIFLVLLQPNLWRGFKVLGLPPFELSAEYSAVTIALSVCCVVVSLVKRKPDFFALVCVGLVGWIAVATAMNRGDLVVWGTTWLPILATICLVGSFWNSYSRELLFGMMFACSVYLLLNLLVIFQDRNWAIGSQTYLFFGIRTTTFRIALPAIACSLLIDRTDGTVISLRSVALYMLSIAEALIGYCATTLCALALLAVLVGLTTRTDTRRILNSFTYCAAGIGLFVGVVILRIQNWFSWFVEGVLHKSLSLSGRTEVWDAALVLLSNSHLLYGYGASYLWTTIYAYNRWMMHAHNDVLNLMMAGGVPAIVLLLAIVLTVAKRLYGHRTDQKAALLACVLFIFMFIGLVEVTNCAGCYFIVGVGYYAFETAEAKE